MRLAFLYIAEAYQAYHCAAVMFELMGRSGITVDVFYIDPATPHTLERLRRAHGAAPFPLHHLEPGLLGNAIQRVRLLGLAKPQVLAKNEHLLRNYDAVVSTEDGIVQLFKGEPETKRPARIVMTHGGGGRDVPSFIHLKHADLLLLKGERDVEHYVARGYAEPDRAIAAGYTKFASSEALAQSIEPLFPNDNPITLYNPHKERSQRSWDKFFKPLMEGFRSDHSRNLIVAPHMKMFRRRSTAVHERMRALSETNILVDPGSDRCLDNTYTELADIYVGDVSSQVYEFIVRPRPCVFLNAHGVAWEDDRNYAMWKMGEVVNDPQDLMAAIARAPQVHDRYAELQREVAEEMLGLRGEAAVQKSADAIEALISRRTAK